MFYHINHINQTCPDLFASSDNFGMEDCLKEDKGKAFTLNPVNQTDSNTLLVKGLPFGTNVNPDATFNVLSESR